jgi:hypothetical protein
MKTCGKSAIYFMKLIKRSFFREQSKSNQEEKQQILNNYSAAIKDESSYIHLTSQQQKEKKSHLASKAVKQAKEQLSFLRVTNCSRFVPSLSAERFFERSSQDDGSLHAYSFQPNFPHQFLIAFEPL